MKKRKLSEYEYINGFREKNSAVIEVFYEDNFHVVENYIKNRGGLTSDAEDVMQDGIMIILRNVNRNGFSTKDRLGKYFMGVCKNLWSRQLQNKKIADQTKLEVSEQVLLQENESDSLKRKQQESLYEECLKLISTLCQLLLTMRNRKYTYKKILEELDLKNVDNARQRKRYCQEKLISLVKNHKDYYKL